MAPNTGHHGAAGMPGSYCPEMFENGDDRAIHTQPKLVGEHHAPRIREFAFCCSTAVATLFCGHQEHPLPLSGGLFVTQRKLPGKGRGCS